MKITVDQLKKLEISGDEALVSSLLPEILTTIIPKYEEYKVEWLEAWRKGSSSSLPHYDREKRFKFKKNLLISIEFYYTEGFFIRGPWIKVWGWASRKVSTPIFTVKALIE